MVYSKGIILTFVFLEQGETTEKTWESEQFCQGRDVNVGRSEYEVDSEAKPCYCLKQENLIWLLDSNITKSC